MLKRKYCNRHDWKRIIKRRYAQSFVDTDHFKGYITLIDMVQVTKPLAVSYEKRDICLVDDGYMWMQQFPIGKNHMVTTTFNHKGDIVQWYIDICLEYEMENEIPTIEDLFLDIVVLPNGKVYLLDEDELEEVLNKRIINQELYDLAWAEAKRVMNLIEKNEFKLLEQANLHKEILTELLEIPE